METRARELHAGAMKLTQLAKVARQKEDHAQAHGLTRKAYALEARAAGLIPANEASEPTRSILYRSAASLAYQCKEFRAARRLIGQALIGYPPTEITQELAELLALLNKSLYVAWGLAPSAFLAGRRSE